MRRFYFTYFIADEHTIDLKGTIPTELLLLSNLELLDLSNSPQLVGTIPHQILGYSRVYQQNNGSKALQLQGLYLESTGLSGRFPELPPSKTVHPMAVQPPPRDLRISDSPGVQQYGLPSGAFFHEMSQLTSMRWSLTRDSSPKEGDQNTTISRTFIARTVPTELGLLTNLRGLFLGKCAVTLV